MLVLRYRGLACRRALPGWRPAAAFLNRALQGEDLTESGDGEGTSQLTPAPVPTDLTFSELKAGQKFTCGLSSSRAYCWGAGASGQLGTGSNTSSSVPVEVAGGHTFASLTVGQQHACAVTPEGAAWCCESARRPHRMRQWRLLCFRRLAPSSCSHPAACPRCSLLQGETARLASLAATCQGPPFLWRCRGGSLLLHSLQASSTLAAS